MFILGIIKICGKNMSAVCQSAAHRRKKFVSDAKLFDYQKL